MNGSALFPLAAGKYIDWGVINISVANLLIIGVMVVVFLLALVIPFPSNHDDDAKGGGES